MSQSILADDPAAIRAGLVSYLTRKLAPLYSSGRLRFELAEWIAPLPTSVIARCLRQDAEATADTLAAAVLAHSVKSDPQSAIADVIAVEYPKLDNGERSRLILIAEAMRKLAQENDGCVTETDLFRLGFGLTEQHRFKDRVEHVLAVVDGRALPRGDRDVCASTRLIEVGVRASARRPGFALSLAV